jgi:hypothetical protein
MTGAVLALALIGALSAGMASGVERARRKKFPRAPEALPPTEAVSPRDESGLRARAPSTRLPAAPRDDNQTVAPAYGEHRPHPIPETPNKVAPAPMITGATRSPAEVTAESHDVASPTVLPTTARIPAPLHVSWTVVESRADTVRLVARLERSPGFTAPVQVSLRVPSRASIQEGPTSPLVLGTDVQEVPWTLRLPDASQPGEDLVLTASAEDEAFGVHAEARYHFGRALAEAPRPAPSGPPLPDALLRSPE